MRVAAVILNWNQAALTEAAARSVAQQVDLVYLVDNGSRPDDRAAVAALAARLATILVESPVNRGYAGGTNLGIRRALLDGADAVLVMNNDALAEPGAVRLLEERLRAEPRVGAVAPAEVSLDGRTVNHTACWLDESTGKTGFRHAGARPDELGKDPIETDYVSGAAFLARREALLAAGLFDERFFCYYEDTDWGVRARRAGFRLEVVPAAVFRHAVHGTASTLTSAFYIARNRPLLLRRTLGMSRLETLRLSMGPTARLVISLLRRGRVWPALRGALAGWLLGLWRALRHSNEVPALGALERRPEGDEVVGPAAVEVEYTQPRLGQNRENLVRAGLARWDAQPGVLEDDHRAVPGERAASAPEHARLGALHVDLDEGWRVAVREALVEGLDGNGDPFRAVTAGAGPIDEAAQGRPGRHDRERGIPGRVGDGALAHVHLREARPKDCCCGRDRLVRHVPASGGAADDLGEHAPARGADVDAARVLAKQDGEHQAQVLHVPPVSPSLAGGEDTLPESHGRLEPEPEEDALRSSPQAGHPRILDEPTCAC